jgi:uncharacterized membrane-anchored protein
VTSEGEARAASDSWISGLAQHPLRDALTNEVHARPFEALRAPVRASHIAVLSGEEGAVGDRSHVARLCARYGAPPPPEGANYYSRDLGPFHLRWERHTEFSTYTFFQGGKFRAPFEDPVLSLVARDWLDDIPGETLVAIHLALESSGGDERTPEGISRLFDHYPVVASRVSGGAARVWTDFRVHDDGWSRVLLHDLNLREHAAGRVVQRLLEIETYRMMALLALPSASESVPRLAVLGKTLSEATARMETLADVEGEQALLVELSRLASEVEHLASSTSYRFGAARAYYALVGKRIEELREERIEGFQTIDEFMERRLAPAMRTCESVADRIQDLSRRVTRVGNLLRTRVNIELEHQNRNLLRSMDHRAGLQLRLQNLVEGLSVAAISYYVVGLIGVALEAFEGVGSAFDPSLARGISVLPVVLLVWFGIRRLRKAAFRKDSEPPVQ